jgi:HD-like signal output (HDOD) protein
MATFPTSALSRPPAIEQVCARALKLPCSPALLPRLEALLVSPDSSADEIADLIKVDSALAASTLRLANSAYFASGGTAATITEAVMRLGHGELYRLAALALVSRWESCSTRGQPGDFCRHALYTAIAAEVMAETTERGDPQAAYTAGLMCALGKLAVAHACAAFFPAIRTHCMTRGGTWSQAEREVLGFTHGEVCARLLKAWRFPEDLAIAIEYCDRPTEGPAGAFPLLAQLHAAKYVANSLGRGVSEDGFLFELKTTFLVEWGFTFELLRESVTVVHDRAQRLMQDPVMHGAVGV